MLAEAPAAATSARPVQAAIAARRSVRKFASRPIARPILERLLDAAMCAPNHRRTEPWRFYVLDREGPIRSRMADLAYEVAVQRSHNSTDPGVESRAEGKRREILDAPAIMAIYSIPGRNEEESRENYSAVSCAVENAMLAAVEEGLVSGWSTGGICGDPRLGELVGADPSWQLTALLYIGYPDPAVIPAAVHRSDVAKHARWLTD